MYYVGLDIGGTTIKAGVVDASGTIQETRAVPTHAENLDALVASLIDLLADFARGGRISAAGIGIPARFFATLRGADVAQQFKIMVADYIENRFGAGKAAAE